MRILTVHEGYGDAIAGAERMAWRGAAALADRGHEVVVVTRGSSEHPSLRVVDGLLWVTATPETLGQAAGLAGWAPDVVHVVDLAESGLAAAGARLADQAGCRLAVTPATAPGAWRDDAGALEVCARADVLLVLSATEEATLRAAGVGPASVATIPQGPDLTGVGDPARFRDRFGLTGRIVLYLGRKALFKGFDVLLDAAPAIWRAHPDVRIVLLGPAWDDDAAAQVAATGDARLLDLGLVDSATKHDALAAAEMLCLPSRVDVFPLAFVEAWTCGVPVIAGSYEGVHDVVRDGVDGVVAGSVPAALAAAVIGLLSDPARARRLGEAGRQRARRDLTWEAVGAAMEAALRPPALRPIPRRPILTGDRTCEPS